jgi:hypothetical protein
MVKTPVIGIPNYWWKKRAVKFAKNNPNLVQIINRDLCYECDRHKELLDYFDSGNTNYKGTKYWDYYSGKKNSSVINRKIKRYKKLYNSIKEHGYNGTGAISIVITDDGCRLDGSHRLTILLHLKILEISVNVVSYEDIFSAKKSKEIRRLNKQYRQEIYGL